MRKVRAALPSLAPSRHPGALADVARVSVVVAPGHEVKLSPGAHNDLFKAIIEEFCPRFTPGGRVLYVGDTGEKWAYFEREALAALGVTVGEHGKMPDVLVHHTAANWLVLVEAVTSHGPVSPKRRAELHPLFKASSAGLVFVTAFADRRAMTKYLGDISWETEVWIADAPSHMIHFNGERFLGPY
jgi:type II restriction enzyme